MTQPVFCGWDIGGAHLKLVTLSATGQLLTACQLAAPIWRGLEYLHQAMAGALEQWPTAESRHAITMTGELADCFPDRMTGVTSLLAAAEYALGPRLQVYMPEGLSDLPSARGRPGEVASANWHASAETISRRHQQAVLIDIGSTTTDIIAIRDGRPVVAGYTDQMRMQNAELVYTGVVRTPVMALAQRAPVAGCDQYLASEQFANMADVYRLTGELPEDADQMPTCDGGPRDQPGSARRLARMACADFHVPELRQWQALAGYIRQCQLALLATALERVITHHHLPSDAVIVGAGCGRFLVHQLAADCQRTYVDAADCVAGSEGARRRAADMLPAYAMAELLIERYSKARIKTP